MKKIISGCLAFTCLLSADINYNTFFSLLQSKPNNEWIDQLNSWGVLSNPINRNFKSDAFQLPLAKQYPGIKQLPHITLFEGFTPIYKLEKLGAELQIPSFYLKHDGFTDGKRYTGNKRRKLEFELAQALAYGARCVITFGCAGSNHAVATSEYAKILDLECICMLKPQANSHVARKNLLLHQTNNSHLFYYPNNEIRKAATICKWIEYKNTYGDYPYIIPTGASTPLATVSYVNAIFELHDQIKAGLLPEPDYIYVPCGSAATTAGLLLGCKATGLKSKIMAIATEPDEEPNGFKKAITHLFYATNTLLHEYDATFPLFVLNENDLEINLNYTGPDYAVFTPECIEARTLLKEYETIKIDGTYTAKAFAGLIADARANIINDAVILFWDTYCDYDFQERLATVDYKKLPVCFHEYFENDVQELDRFLGV